MTFDISRMKTRMTVEQIVSMVGRNPAAMVDEANIRLPPARLSFANIAKPGKNLNSATEPGKYGSNLLFTPNADLTLLKQLRDKTLAAAFPANPTGVGMKNPFRNQADRVAPADGGANVKGKSTPGYTPGWTFIIPTSNYRPALWVPPFVPGPTGVLAPTPFQGSEAEMDNMFYAGCWCIAVVNAYKAGNAQNPGVFFGLQSLLKIADDEKLGGAGGGAGANPAAFGGVSIDASVNPASLF